MYAWLFKGSELIAYPILALFLFLGAFLSVVVRAYGRGTARRFAPVAAMPLVDEERHGPTDGAE